MPNYTKWEFLSEEDREGYQNTPFGHRCTFCDVMLETEADFAKHFIVRDIRYLNLGECPNSMLKTKVAGSDRRWGDRA